jgi:RHS repeat-associated protein
VRWRPTARTRLTTLWVVASLCYQLLLPLPSIASPAMPPELDPTVIAGDPPPDDAQPAPPAPIIPVDPAVPAEADIGIRPEFGPSGASLPTSPTELPELRKEHSRVVANPDGTFSLQVSNNRLNFQDDTGVWQPVDLSLISSASGPYDFRVKALDREVRFSDGDSDQGLASLSAGPFGLELRTFGYTSTASRQASRLNFPGAAANGEVWVQPTDTGFEWGVTLADANRASAYHFALNLGSLTARLAGDGRSVILEDPTGDFSEGQAGPLAVGYIDAPVLQDANGAPADPGTVSVQLIDRNTASLPTDVPSSDVSSLADHEIILRYGIDAGWLKAKGRAFPVTLDPTACLGYQAAGCTINVHLDQPPASPAAFEWFINYIGVIPSGWTVMRVGYDARNDDPNSSTDWKVLRGMYYFPDTVLPDGAQVTKATLRLEPGFIAGSPNNKTMHAYLINKAWSNSTATTWTSHASAYDSSVSSSALTTTFSIGTPVTFTVTNIARAWYTRRSADWRTPLGFMVKFDSEPSNTGEVDFRKTGSTTTSTSSPLLTLTYALPGVQFDFDPALGENYAPSAMVAGQVTKLPVTVTNTSNTFPNTAHPSSLGYAPITFNTSADSDGLFYELGWRWFDAKGKLVTCPGTCVKTFANALAAGASQNLVLNVTAPSLQGQYTLRLDLVHVDAAGKLLYASDWAKPSQYYARDKRTTSSPVNNTRWTGASVIERDEFSIAVGDGSGTNVGNLQSAKLGDGSKLGINLANQNVHFEGGGGIGFADLLNLGIGYGYDLNKAKTCNVAAYNGILGACGWSLNYDERFSPGFADYQYVYQDPSGNSSFVATDSEGQLVSGAQNLLERARVTWWEENSSSTSTDVVTAASQGITAPNGSAYILKASSSSNTVRTTVPKVDLTSYPTLHFSLRTTAAAGAGVAIQIHNATDPTGHPDAWFAYTAGTNWTTGYPQIALGGTVLNAWPSFSRDFGYDLVNQGFASQGDVLEAIAWQSLGNGTAGSEFFDSVRFSPAYDTSIDEDVPAWTANAGLGNQLSTDEVRGTYSILIEPASLSASPVCGSTACMDDMTVGGKKDPSGGTTKAFPWVTWSWKKVGGASVAMQFTFKDTRSGSGPGGSGYKTGSITYYAGTKPTSGIPSTCGTGTETCSIQISPQVPSSWATVTRNLLADARQMLGFFNESPNGTDPNAPPANGPVGDGVAMTSLTAAAIDGNFALIDRIQFFTTPNNGKDEYGDDSQTLPTYDFVATYRNGEQHFFNRDGLINRIADQDGNETTFDWTLNTAKSGQLAYTLATIHAASDGTTSGSNTYNREITLATTAPTGFNLKTFTEKLGTTGSPITGRQMNFYVASQNDVNGLWGTGDLVKVSPARKNGTCPGTRPTGCTEFLYTGITGHTLSHAVDPRWDGTTSGATDYRFQVVYTGSTPYAITDRHALSASQLYVASFDTGTSTNYKRVLFQNTAGRQAGYAIYQDLSPEGQPLTSYVPKPCVGTCAINSSGTFPSAPTSSQITNQSTFDGLSRISEVTTYRCNSDAGTRPAGCTSSVDLKTMARQATQAALKVDNYADPLTAGQPVWSQTADQYLQSLIDSVGTDEDLYRTDYLYAGDRWNGTRDRVIVGHVVNAISPVSRRTATGSAAVSVGTQTVYDSEGHPTQVANELALNGSFENGLASWNHSAGATAYLVDIADAFTRNSSSFGSALTPAADYVRQEIQLSAGQTFRFQVSGRTNGTGGAHATLQLTYWDSGAGAYTNISGMPVQVSTSSSWADAAYDVTVPLTNLNGSPNLDGRVQIKLYDDAGVGSAYWDNASLTMSWRLTAYYTNGTALATYTLKAADGSTYSDAISRYFAHAGTSTTPPIFPTSQIVNFVTGVYDDDIRDADLTTTRTFDTWGRVLTTTDPDGVNATTAYAANKTDVASSTDGLENVTAYTYDAVGNRLTTTSPAGLITTTTYDLLNNPVRVTAPDGVASQNTYNNAGQRTASYSNYVDGSPSGASGIDDVKTTYSYDRYGHQLTSVVDTGYAGSPDATTTLTYDLLGNVVTAAASGTGVTARTTTNYFTTKGFSGSTYSRTVPTGVREPIAPPTSAPDCPGNPGIDCTTVDTLDVNGRVFTTIDTYNKATITDYDLLGHPVRAIANYVDGVYSGVSPDTDVVSSVQYDVLGRMVATTTCGVTCSGGDLRIVRTTFDDVDRPIQQMTEMPAGTDYSFTKTVYLPSGRVERTSAPAAAGTADTALTWTKTEYDGAGRAVRTLAHNDIGGYARYQLEAFESSTTTGWSSAASGYFTSAAAGSMGLDNDYHTTGPKSGAGRLRLTTHASNGFNGGWWDLSGQIFQAGRPYHLHADLVAWSGNTLQAFFGVDASGASYGSSGAIATTGTWQTIDIDWTPTSTVSSNVHFALRKDTAGAINAYLDNVQVWDTLYPDRNLPSETAYNVDGLPIASVLPPGHPGEAPLVTTTAYDPAGRSVAVSVNARTLYSHQIMADGQTNGLVSYWPLDERSGTSVADKKGTNAATYVGSFNQGVGGAVDESLPALHLSGATSYVNVPDAASLDLSTALTLEFWANSDLLLDSSKPANTSFGGVTKTSTYGLGWTTKISGGGWRFNLVSGATSFYADSATMAVEPHRWYHLMGTYDGNVMKLYVDGTLVGSNTIGAKTIDNTINSFRLGQWDSTYWTGAIDDVSLYNVGLSSATAHYAAGHSTSSDGRLTTRTEYDVLGRPTTETSPRGIRTASTYDRLGRTTSTSANYRDGSPAGAATDDDLTANFAYDALGELLGSCPPQQVYLGGCAPATSSNAQAWHYTYDAMGHQVTQVPPVNQTLTALDSRSWTYDAGGRLTTMCDYAAGGSCATASRHTDTTYDGLGRVLTSKVYAGAGTGSLKLSWTNTWKPDGSQATAAFDGGGSSEGTDTLTYIYDGLGRPDQVKRGEIVLTDNAWSANGTLASRIDGTLGASTFAYDWAQRLTSTSSPVYAGSQTFAWRLDGLMDSRQWASGSAGAASFSYDAANRPTGFSKIGTAAASFGQTYDRDGNVTSEDRSLTGVLGLAALGAQTFTYDGANRVSAATLGTPPPGDSSAPTTPAGLSATAIAADRVDLSWTASTDDLAVVRYRIYRDGAPISEVAGATTTLSDRSTAPSTAYAYTVDAVDAAGNASSQSGSANATTQGAGSGTVTDPPSTNDAGWTNSANAYASDDTYATAAPAKNQTATLNLGTFGFDAAIPVGATITNVTVSVEWKVDVTSSIATLGSQAYVNGVAQGTELVNSAEPTTDTVETYSVSGLTRADLLDGVLTIRNRISRGNDNQAVAASLDAVSVQVDYSTALPPDTTAPSVPSGLAATAASSSRVDLSWTASTDDVAMQGYRIYRDGGLLATTASTSYADTSVAGSTTYSYTVAAIDGAGNASAESSSAGATTPSAAGIAYAYAYDRDANRTSASAGSVTTTYAYDRTGELRSRTDGGSASYLAYDRYGNQTSSAPAVNLNTASTYDLADRLTSITPPGETATTFAFDALGRNLTRITPAGTDTYEYIDATETVWRITTAGLPTTSAIDPSGARLATSANGTSGYLLPDLQANLAAVVNAGESAILAATRYDAFGQTAAAYDSGGSFPTPWRFQGRLDVSPDGHPLYDFGARNYDPAIGAFTSLDTYAGAPGDPLSLNRYLYAEANPWTLIDPDGHRPCLDTGTTCETSADTDQLWEQNKQEAQRQEKRIAESINNYACARTGECVTRAYSTTPTAPPGMTWSTYTINGQHQLLGPGCTEDADRHLHGDCAPDAEGALLISLGVGTAIVTVAASGAFVLDWGLGALAAGSTGASTYVASHPDTIEEAAAGVTTRDLAVQVAESTGGIIDRLTGGYSVTIPDVGPRGVLVRLMDYSATRTNYWRLVEPGLSTYTRTGAISSLREQTHPDIDASTLGDILRIIEQIANR